MNSGVTIRLARLVSLVVFLFGGFKDRASADIDFVLVDVPDYDWYGGCFGTGAGNLMGYWDRHGLPGFYTGPTGGGLAPLNSYDAPLITNSGIRSMFTSKAGMDGRPANKPGHIDDYWGAYPSSYESSAADPYEIARRPEHTNDCIGDFIGLSQRKWTNMNNECDGNIDAYSFVYWNLNGDRRVNFVPPTTAGTPARDIQSGLREWTRFKGYDAEVFTQLTDFNPTVPAGHGFTFNDMKAEIDAGFPVLLYLQRFTDLSRSIPPMTKANPVIHGMMAYGYYIFDDGRKFVHYRTSWGDSSGNDFIVSEWNGLNWQAGLPVRGVIGYHPKPKITSAVRTNGNFIVSWEGPDSRLRDVNTDTTTPVNRYVLERAPSLTEPFVAVTDPSPEHTATVQNCCSGTTFFRVRLITPQNP